MEKLVEKGLVRAIGLSNFNSRQINDVLSMANIKPTVLQVGRKGDISGYLHGSVKSLEIKCKSDVGYSVL